MMGEPFFDCQVGFVGCRAMCMKSIMGVRDFEENVHQCKEVTTSLTSRVKKKENNTKLKKGLLFINDF